jgi:hypothetical protein
VRRDNQREHAGASPQDLRGGCPRAEQTSRKSRHLTAVEERAHDPHRIRPGVVGISPLPIRVHPDQVGDLDLQYQRPVHLKLQGPAHQILCLSG